MGGEAAKESASAESDAERRYRDLVVPLVWLGLALALGGVVIGLVMAFKRTEVQCEDGTTFPEGAEDFRCFAHPEGLEGSAIVVLSLILAAVIVLIGAVAKTLLLAPPRPQSDSTNP